jgi:uncharacterized membrane protein
MVQTLKKHWIFLSLLVLYLFFTLSLVGTKDLWGDELWVISSITRHSFYQMLFPVAGAHLQLTPPLYLIAVRAIVAVFPANETSLRAVSLIFGIMSLVLVYTLCLKLFKSTWAAGFASGLFMLCPEIINYSMETKAYIVDVFFFLLFIYLAERYISKPSWKTCLPIAIVTPLSFGFSFVSIISFTVVFLVMSIDFLWDKKTQQRALEIGLVTLSGLVSFAIVYLLFIKTPSHSELLLGFWQNRFIAGSSLGPLILSVTYSTWSLFQYFFADLGGSVITAISICLFFFGLLMAWTHNQKRLALYISLPFIIAIMLAVLKKYPYGNRVDLFLLLSIIFAVTYGIQALFEIIKPKRETILILASMGLVLVCFQMTIFARNGSYYRNQVRTLFDYYRKNLDHDDYTFVNYRAASDFRYYCADCASKNVIVTTSPKGNIGGYTLTLEKDIDAVPTDSRWWFFFARQLYSPQETAEILSTITSQCTIEKQIVDYNAVLYLATCR